MLLCVAKFYKLFNMTLFDTNIVLCGGLGKRLWPLSHQARPKPFIPLFEDGSTLLQNTLQRQQCLADNHLIVAKAQHAELLHEQLQSFNDLAYTCLLELTSRNTAFAIALACCHLPQQAVVLVTPSDHWIEPFSSYSQALQNVAAYAYDGEIVALGIATQYEATGYGYLQLRDNDVVRFIEKPDLEQARVYHQASDYFWNSGIYSFRVDVMYQCLSDYAPQVLQAAKQAYQAIQDDHNTFLRVGEPEIDCSHISIDHAVMEKASRLKAVKADMTWSDLGTVASLQNKVPSDTHQQHNAAHNNWIKSHTPVHCINCKHLTIANSEAGLLVEALSQVVYRPWGYYQCLQTASNYQVKKLVVERGQRLSLQKHYYRSEHWTVVQGRAQVTLEDQIYYLKTNESMDIGVGQVHRLANLYDTPLVIIETQISPDHYISEDDIERLDDDFQR